MKTKQDHKKRVDFNSLQEKKKAKSYTFATLGLTKTLTNIEKKLWKDKCSPPSPSISAYKQQVAEFQ